MNATYEINQLLNDMTSDGDVHGSIDRNQFTIAMTHAAKANEAAASLVSTLIKFGEKTFKKDWYNRDLVVFTWDKEQEANVMRDYLNKLAVAINARNS